MRLFIDHLFLSFDFLKLYAEVSGVDYGQFARGAGTFFEVEGTLKDHFFAGGGREDLYILAFHRLRWMEQTRRLDVLRTSVVEATKARRTPDT